MAGQNIFRPTRRSFAFLLFLFAAVLALMVGLVSVDNSHVEVERINITLPALPSQLEGFTILQISDLHGRTFGEGQKGIVSALGGARFDAAVLLGDMLSPSGDAEAFHGLVKALAETGKPVYCVTGDEDPALDGPIGADKWGLQPWAQGAADLGAVFLDAPVALAQKPVAVWLMPAMLTSTDVSQTIKSLESAAADALTDQRVVGAAREQRLARVNMGLFALTRTKEAFAAMKPSDIVVGASHFPLTPSFAKDLQQHAATATTVRMDVLLAGHYCGGGVRLPVVGPMHVPAPRLPRGGWWPEEEQTSGLSAVGDTSQVITRGLGVSSEQKPLRVRVLNAPGVTLVRFTTKW